MVRNSESPGHNNGHNTRRVLERELARVRSEMAKDSLVSETPDIPEAELEKTLARVRTEMRSAPASTPKEGTNKKKRGIETKEWRARRQRELAAEKKVEKETVKARAVVDPAKYVARLPAMSEEEMLEIVAAEAAKDALATTDGLQGNITNTVSDPKVPPPLPTGKRPAAIMQDAAKASAVKGKHLDDLRAYLEELQARHGAVIDKAERMLGGQPQSKEWIEEPRQPGDAPRTRLTDPHAHRLGNGNDIQSEHHIGDTQRISTRRIRDGITKVTPVEPVAKTERREISGAEQETRGHSTYVGQEGGEQALGEVIGRQKEATDTGFNPYRWYRLIVDGVKKTIDESGEIHLPNEAHGVTEHQWTRKSSQEADSRKPSVSGMGGRLPPMFGNHATIDERELQKEKERQAGFDQMRKDKPWKQARKERRNKLKENVKLRWEGGPKIVPIEKARGGAYAKLIEWADAGGTSEEIRDRDEAARRAAKEYGPYGRRLMQEGNHRVVINKAELILPHVQRERKVRKEAWARTASSDAEQTAENGDGAQSEITLQPEAVLPPEQRTEVVDVDARLVDEAMIESVERNDFEKRLRRSEEVVIDAVLEKRKMPGDKISLGFWERYIQSSTRSYQRAIRGDFGALNEWAGPSDIEKRDAVKAAVDEIGRDAAKHLMEKDPKKLMMRALEIYLENRRKLGY